MFKKKPFITNILINTTIATASIVMPLFNVAQTLTKYVDPFIGTGAHGHTYPGATVPFGMVQLSPDNGTQGWDWCSGYHYANFMKRSASWKNLFDPATGFIRAKNAGKGRPYIQSVQLNNQPYTKACIQHTTMMRGGVIEFTMSSIPNKSFGLLLPSWLALATQ